MKNLAMLLILGAALILAAGCGGGDDAATQAEEAATQVEEAAAQAKEAAPAEVAAVHDCAGGCGMKAVPEAQMTEIEGKWYCAGCAAKIKVEEIKHDPDTE